MAQRDALRQTNINISDDYPKNVDENRKKLLPALREGSKIGLDTKLIGDKLIVNGRPYTKDTMHKLPIQLRPEALYTPSKDGMTAFFTSQSPLSNHFKCNFTVNEEPFNSAEQFIMVCKARRFNDMETVSKLFKEENPKQQLELGKTVKNFNNTTWLSEVDRLVYPGLLAKFTQSDQLASFLLKTGDNLIVEASKNKIWGVGLHLRDPNLWNKQNHAENGNKLGKLLMKVRKHLHDEIK